MIVVVTGTGTEVGKTYVTAALARALGAHGVAVKARKPVQSYAPGEARTDADVLAAATGETADVVCPAHRRLPLPLAPPMAAEALGQPPFTIADLVRELDAPARGILLVEGAGGVCSPLAADGDTAALAARLRPALVVLVADAGLGTINLVRLAASALAGPLAVFVNRFDAAVDVHVRNERWLREREGLDVVTDIEALATRVLRAARG